MTKKEHDFRIGDKVRVKDASKDALVGFDGESVYNILESYLGGSSFEYKLQRRGLVGFTDSDNLTLVSRTNLRKGDKVRYLGDVQGEGFIEWAEVGETLTIEGVCGVINQSVFATRGDGVTLYYRPYELEYIVEEEEEPKRDIHGLTYEDAIYRVYDRVTELEVEVAKLKAEEEYVVELNGKIIAGNCEADCVKTFTPKPNELRAKAIEAAKDFIRMVEGGASSDKQSLFGNSLFRTLATEVRYTTCPRTGTVTAEAIGEVTGRNRGPGSYVFENGETFNEYIGKALALAELYELEAPVRVADYPEPDEAVVGSVVKTWGITHRLETVSDARHFKDAVILDDTKAQY